MEQAPNIYPVLRYADAEAALEWLGRAFGFKELVVHRGGEDSKGPIQHVEMSLGPGIVMFGPGDPREHGIYVAVEDADAHHEQAKAAGAEITREIEDTDYGSREYTARDLEGNVWSFGTFRPSVG
jgi:uncharacterized glyoxalase superfamily protein PhnB